MIISDKLDKLSYDNYFTNSIIEKEDGLYSYYFLITEYIGTTAGTGVNGPETSSIRYAFKGVKQYGDYWDYEDYIFNGTTKKFLTEKTTRNYKLDEYGTLDYFYGLWGGVDVEDDLIEIKVYSEGGITKYYFNNYPVSPSIKGIYTIPVGPKQINEMAVSGFIDTSGGTPTTGEILHDKDYIDPTVRYEITYMNSLKVAKSESILITINHNCYKHEGVEFLYLGNLGSYETFTARQGKVKSYKTKKSEIKRNPNHIVDDQYHYNVGDRGRTIVNSRTTESGAVITDWMSDEEAGDLMELFNSTDVYIIENSNTTPIVITNTTYDVKNVKNDRLFSYNISYEMSYEKLSNR
jgi:hypothetical protein